MNVKTNIKAGPNVTLKRGIVNHNQTQVQRTRGLKVQTGVKAGPIEIRELVIKTTVKP